MAVIETTQPLSIESFSYSWLINLKPSLIESLSDSFRAALDESWSSSSSSSSSSCSSFIEMDPNMPPSRRFTKLDNNHEFDFNVPPPVLDDDQSVLVHADELFSNGQLLPLVLDTTSTRRQSLSSSSRPGFSSVGNQKKKIHSSSLRRCRSLLSRKMIEKYLCFLCPFLLKKIRLLTTKSKQTSLQGSPRGSVCSSPGDLVPCFESESSIREAVLHCKRSFGK